MTSAIFQDQIIKPQFQIFFLEDDADQIVRISEVEEIDFEDVIIHLRRGDSIYIKPLLKKKSLQKF